MAFLLVFIAGIGAQNFEAPKLNADEFTKTSVKVGAEIGRAHV